MRYHARVPRATPQPPPEAPVDDLFALIDRLGHLLRHDLRAGGAGDGLEPVHLQALDYLTRANRVSDTPVAVAEYLGLTKGNVSQRLLALERAGLVQRTPDADDGRVSHLQPTEAGQARLAAAVPPPAWREALRALPPSQRRALETGLRALLAALQRARGGRSFGVCRTCRHFVRVGDAARCGLTGEALAASQTLRICREHAPAS